MTYCELLQTAESIVKALRKADARLTDIDHLEMHRNFKRLVKEGHKMEYILQYLSDVYGYHPRHIRRICDRLDKEISM